MREINYTPDACKPGEKQSMQGSVIITVPTFDERYGYIEEAGFETNDKGDIEGGVKNLKAIRKMVQLSQKHYKAVNLKKLDGVEVKSFEAMVDEPDCDAVLIEVAMQLMNGFKASKN